MFRCLILALALSSVASAADNWPSWRGPTANGVAASDANPPTKWDEKTNIKWKADLPGKGSATPVVWGDQVFVLTAVPGREAKPEELPKVDRRFETKTEVPHNFYSFEVLSFDRTTGKPLWKKTAAEAVPHEGHHPTHSYAAGSPATDGKRLYVSFGSFGVFAFDLKGEQIWKRDLGRIHSRLGWGEAVTPVVHGDTVILNWDQEDGSKLIALDAATGDTKWEVKRDEKTSWNTPLIVEHGGTTQVLVNGTNRARAYNLVDGKVLWEVSGMTVNAIPSPLAADGVAYIVSGYRGAMAVAVPLDSRGEVAKDGVKWRYAKGTPYVPSPLLFDGRLYFTEANTQLLTVLDAKTGKPLQERERLQRVGSFYASPLAAAGRLYFVDRDGTTAVLSAGDKPEVLATNKLDDKTDASPVAVGKTLYLRGEKHLYAIEEK
ncbi:serine/threonine protein kinase [Limnoglobus roseus]|uniref:Serine/threonine protein kinase n=2 Tax=Limnoglobus roseus TaxID=2598579 RepID=A0A5C1AD50_9BACT|nr:serine/threonine protein kinase [Limnoglobus roseus]